MQAQDRPFTQLLEGAKQFIIPIFQRTYSWELEHCAQLWSDILRIGENDNLQTHFVGSVVYIPEEGVDAAIPRWLVIDGQQRIHEQYIHTLGNLTLTGYNSEYSDHAFSKKRDMKGGFRFSPLKLNQGIVAEERWNEGAINQRASKLASEALQVWRSPTLSPETQKGETTILDRRSPA